MPKQLSDGDTDGTVLGQSASDKIGFFGADPVVQPAAIASLSTSAAASTIATTVNEVITALRNLGAITS